MAAEEKNGLFELHENTRAGVLANPTLPNRAVSLAADTRTLIIRTSTSEILEFEAGAKLNVDLLGVPGGVAQLGGDGKLPNSAISDNGSDATPQDLVEVPLAGTATTYSRGDHKHKYPTPTQIGAEPSLGTPGAGTWFLRTVAGVRSWIASIPWTSVDKTGAVAGDVGALAKLTLTGTVDFDSINSGNPCEASINATTLFHAPPGMPGTTECTLLQDGSTTAKTQILTSVAGVAFRLWRTSTGWGGWVYLYDEYYLPMSTLAKDLLNDTTSSQMRSTIGAAATSHNHSTDALTSGIVSTARGGTGSATLPSGFAVSVGEQLVTLPQAEKSVAFFETAHGGFNAALLSDEFEITGPPTGPTIGIAEVAWSKVDKTGAAATEVGALPATTVSGAINFDSINGGLPCAWSLAGASYTNGPPGASSTTGYFLVQGVGRDGLRTQYVTDTKFGGSFHRFQTSSGGGAWSSWFAILDDAREGVDPKSGSWEINPLTKKMVKQTSAGTITLPTASATYAGFRTTVTSTFAGNITIAGTFEYLDPNNTPSYWYNTAGSLAFAVNSGSGSGYRVSFDIWCDGVYWYVRF